MIIEVLLLLEGLLDGLCETYIHTPHKPPANKNKPFIVLTAPNQANEITSVCGILKEEQIVIYIVEGEKHDIETLRVLSRKVENILRNFKGISYNSTRVHDTRDIYTNTGFYGLNNKENWLVSATIVYG